MALQDVPIEQRNTEVHETGIPDFQSTFNDLAKSQNNLSAIGAQVAQSASNQIASQLGYASGKTPHGDLTPPITDFDKTFSETYQTQANATLSQQGEKLLDDAHVEMSKPARLTPELIDQTTQQLQQGLTKIAAQAPTAVKSSLENTFNSQLLHQTMQYKTKMITDQREDQKNNALDAVDIATKNALQFGINGDLKGSGVAVDSANKMIDNLVANKSITPIVARTLKETVTQSALNGHFINQAVNAYKNNKYPEFQRMYADKKIPGTESMTNEQWVATANAMNEQVNFIQGLKNQDENLKVQDMLNRIAINPKISNTEWTNFASTVTPAMAEKVQFHWIQALKRTQSKGAGVDNLIQNWSDPQAHANATRTVQNASFNKGVSYMMQQGEQQGNPISAEDAEVKVAASAGAVIPVFTKEIQNKLHSGNPAIMMSASTQIHSLRQMNAGHALAGLSAQDNILNDTFKAMLDSKDPNTAAKDAVTAVLNQDPDVLQANKQKWANKISSQTTGGGSSTDYVLKTFGLKPSTFNLKSDAFSTQALAQVYGADILRNYRTNFLLANGDDNIAKNATQRYVDDNYGDTGVNGDTQKTLHPIEKVLGYSDPGVVPFIQQDAVMQFNKQFAPIKQLYDDKKSNVYYETIPVSKEPINGTPIIRGFPAIPSTENNYSKKYNPIQIVRHERLPNGTFTSQKFNVVLLGNNFDWDVAVQTNSGLRNLYTEAPFLGVLRYQPNADGIRKAYNLANSLK